MVLPLVKVLPKATYWPQWYASLVSTVLNVLVGTTLGWSSPFLAKLTATDSLFPVTEQEGSWIASLLQLGRIPGSVIGSIAAEYFGSKKTLLYSGIPLALSWALMIIADSVPWLYVGRFASGVTMGVTFCIAPIYIGEISSPTIRGALVAMVANGFPFGTLLGGLLGKYFDMWLFAVICLVPNIIVIIVYMFLPESPHYLARCGKFAEAAESIKWYHRDANVDAELDSLKLFVRAGDSSTFMDKFKEIIEPKSRRMFFLIISLFVFMQLSGVNTIVFYMEIILSNAGVTIVAPSTIVICASCFGILACWLAMYLIDKFGRRVLITTSCAGVALALALLATHYTLLDANFDATRLQWLPILGNFMFQGMLCIGLASIPATILSEVFLPGVKSVATCTGSITTAVCAFISTMTYQPLVSAIAEQNVFWIYALIMVFATLYCIWKVPETKGKSLEEIQQMFDKDLKQ